MPYPTHGFEFTCLLGRSWDALWFAYRIQPSQLSSLVGRGVAWRADGCGTDVAKFFLWKMSVSGELCCVTLPFYCGGVVALPLLASLGVIVHGVSGTTVYVSLCMVQRPWWPVEVGMVVCQLQCLFFCSVVCTLYSAGQGHPSDVCSWRRSHKCGTSITESTTCGHQHERWGLSISMDTYYHPRWLHVAINIWH